MKKEKTLNHIKGLIKERIRQYKLIRSIPQKELIEVQTTNHGNFLAYIHSYNTESIRFKLVANEHDYWVFNPRRTNKDYCAIKFIYIEGFKKVSLKDLPLYTHWYSKRQKFYDLLIE